MSIVRPIEQAVVLVGGKGTRLGSLTADTPKPLLLVAGTPFLTWLVGRLAERGVKDVILTAGFAAKTLDPWLRDADLSVRVRTMVENEPLGTGGALPLIADWLDDAFFVLNGDTLFDVDLAALEARLAVSGASVAVALREVEDVSRYGAIELDEDRIVAFGEKERTGPGLINGGVYAFRKRVVERVDSPSSIERDLLPGLVAGGEAAGLVSDGFFIDIGVPETYEGAQKAVPAWWWGRDR